jgi:drug/metabolite transporter (DMT)-like permease
MFGAVLSFMAMAIAGRQLSTELSTFQILFFRSLIGLIVIVALVQRSGWEQVRTKVFSTHLLRNLAHFCGQYGWFYGIARIPLTEVFAIEFTLPIWTAVLAALFLNERMTRRRGVAIAIGFVGVLVILRPGIAIVSSGALAVLGGAFGYAISYVATKRLSGTETPLTILIYMTAIQLPLAFVPSLAHWVWPSSVAWPWVAVVALCALSAHYCLARAFKLADASVVAPMDFVRLPLIAIVGFVLYGERVDIWVFVGAAIVCAGTWLNLKNARQNSAAAVEA